jgi:hypothetical protein
MTRLLIPPRASAPTVTVKEVAELLRVQPHAVRRRAHNDPTFPRPFRPAGTKQLLFWLADVEAFLAGGRPDEAD